MSRKHGGRRWKPQQFITASRNQQRAVLAKLREQGKIRTKSGKVRQVSAIERAVQEKKANRPISESAKKRTEKLLIENKKTFEERNKLAREQAERHPYNPGGVGKVTEYDVEEERLMPSGKMKRRKKRLIEAGVYENQQKEVLSELRKKLARQGISFDPFVSEEKNRENLERSRLKLHELEGRAQRKFARLMEKASPVRAMANKEADKLESGWQKFIARMTGRLQEQEMSKLSPSEKELQKKLAASPMKSQQEIAKWLDQQQGEKSLPASKTEEFEKQGFFVIPPVRRRTGSDITGIEKRQLLSLYGPDRLLVKTQLSKKDKYLLSVPLTKAWTKTVDIASDPKLSRGFGKHEDRIYQEILARYEKGGKQLTEEEKHNIKSPVVSISGIMPNKVSTKKLLVKRPGITNRLWSGLSKEATLDVPSLTYRKQVEDKILELRKKYKDKGLLERFEENPWETTARASKGFSWSKPNKEVFLSEEDLLRTIRETGNKEEQDKNFEAMKFLYGRSQPEIREWLKKKSIENKPDIIMHRQFLKKLQKQSKSLIKERKKIENEQAKKILTIKRKEYKQKLKKDEAAPKWKKFLNKLTQLT